MRYADRFCTYTESQNPHVYVFTGKCVKTGKIVSVTVPAQELYAYRQGGYIQNTLISVNADDREFLMSGISAEGWNLMFPPEEIEVQV